MCDKHRKHIDWGLTGKGFSRRDLLRFSMVGAGIMAMGPLARKGMAAMQSGSQNFMVVINLSGGNDGLNTLIPVNLANYYSQRPTLGIQSGNALDLSGGPGSPTAYRLHSSLSALQGLYNAGNVAFVNKVQYKNPNLSHDESEKFISYGLRDVSTSSSVAPSGWISRYLNEYTSGAFGGVSVNAGNREDFQGTAHKPLVVGRLSSFDFESDNSYSANDQRRKEIIQSIVNGYSSTDVSDDSAHAIRQSHSLFQTIESAVNNYTSSVSYANESPSREMQDIARLVQQGVDTRIFYTRYGGFDTHASQAGSHSNLLARLDRAIDSFAQDMQAIGAWNRTVICVISEFGRRNFENGSNGTDHGTGQLLIFAGGGVNGGIYGPDIAEADLLQNNLDYEVDFRDPLWEILNNHLGASDRTIVFPEEQEKNNGPFNLV